MTSDLFVRMSAIIEFICSGGTCWKINIAANISEMIKL